MIYLQGYELSIVNEQMLHLPIHAEILSVGERHDNIILYALIDDEEKEIICHSIIMIRTGYPLTEPNRFKYLGTVSRCGSIVALHIFEELHKKL